MQIRGKGVDFNTVKSLIENISNEEWDGTLIVHRDARALGSKNDSNYGFTGRIIANSSDAPAARRSWSGRRTNAACWCAWRDAIQAVLTVYPEAVVTTAMARYNGLEGFKEEYPKTANVNIGSAMQPVTMPELCNHD